MERRQQQRIATDIAAILNYPPLGLLGMRIRDISPNGAFVQSHSVRLNLHNTVELLANVPCRERLVDPILATVVRTTRDGAGLMFLTPNPAYPKALLVSPSCTKVASEPPRRTGRRKIFLP